MQQFAVVDDKVAYQPIQGFTSADLGYERGNAVSNVVTKLDDAPMARQYAALFDQIWNNPTQLEDVTQAVYDHIASVYAENSPARVYFLILYNLFSGIPRRHQRGCPAQRPHRLPGNAGLAEPVQLPARCGDGNHQQARDLQRLHPRGQRGTWEDLHRAGSDQVLRAAQQVRPGACTEEAGGELDQLQRQSDHQYFRTRPVQLRRPLLTPIFPAPEVNRWGCGSTESIGATTTSSLSTSRTTSTTPTTQKKESRYQRLMRQVIREGVKTKVLMLSATGQQPLQRPEEPIQLAYGRVGEPQPAPQHLDDGRQPQCSSDAQRVFKWWSKLDPEGTYHRPHPADARRFDLNCSTRSPSRGPIKHISGVLRHHRIRHLPQRLRRGRFREPLSGPPRCARIQRNLRTAPGAHLAVHTPLAYVFPPDR